jgi:hypothetical protein
MEEAAMQANRFSPLVCLLALFVSAAPARSGDDLTVSPALGQMNDRLAQLGLNVRVYQAEAVTGFSGNPVGMTLIANDRDLRQPVQWVPSDARRNADGRNITYLVDQSDATPNGGLSSAQVEAAIDRAMATWNSVSCASIPIVKRVDSGVDPDIIDGLLGFGSVGTPYLASIVHAGWMPPAFFDLLFPGGGSSFLAVTFTMILLDPASGDDINGDHQYDAGFRETYYNNYFAWGINADPPIADVESVALHEAGHGLSLGHFGKIFLNANDSNLHFAPFAVMNSVLFGQSHQLLGTDNAAFCSIWGSWPTK